MASLKELGDLVNARGVGNPKLVIDGVSSLDGEGRSNSGGGRANSGGF